MSVNLQFVMVFDLGNMLVTWDDAFKKWPAGSFSSNSHHKSLDQQVYADTLKGKFTQTLEDVTTGRVDLQLSSKSPQIKLRNKAA